MKTPRTQKKTFSWGRFFLGLSVIFLFMAMLTSIAVFVFFIPSINEFTDAEHGATSVLYDRTGEHVLYQVHGEENRKPINHTDIPKNIRLATIAVEDENFYRHFGIDTRAVFRALRVNLREGGFEQGASTITQQLARSVLLSREKTVERKAIEALLAIKIEFFLTKEEILDQYLNQVPYGANAYGIEAAAETFFDKQAPELTLGEATLLAALPNAPTLYSPYGNNPDLLIQRQHLIIEKLRKNGWVSEEEAARAKEEDILARVVPLKREIHAPHFVFAVLEELEKQYGRDYLETHGLHVYTTLDWEAQQKAEEAVRSGAAKNASWNASNAALVALDTENGEVLAMVGSKDYFDKSIDGAVNVALAPRQPGSSFKPFVYARAFEKGYQPETMLFDLPTSFGPDDQGKEYEPQNYDGNTHGLISMRQALSNSLNIPAVQTQYLAGVDSTLAQVEKMGITVSGNKNRYGLSLVLCGAEVSLLQMTNAYGVFSQDGLYKKASGILRIEDTYGQELFSHEKPEGSRALSQETARKISSILSDNQARSMVFGGSTPLAFKSGGVAAKTGTTQEFRDAWTVGYTQKVAVGIWVGNNDNTPMKAGADGVFVAAPIWRNYMDYLLTRYPATAFPGYTTVTSDKPLITGSLPFSYKSYDSPPQNSKERKRREKDLKKQAQEFHSILYYVNRDEPLSDKAPNLDDPMLARFEAALSGAPKEEKKD